MNPIANFVPADRRRALIHGTALSQHPRGAVLLADLAGFTPATEAIVRARGPHRGAEELLAIINQFYEVLMAEVDRYGGSVVGFAGDSIMAWFESESPTNLFHAGQRAVASALAMQTVTPPFQTISLPGDQTLTLALKTAVATGSFRRLLVGDPSIQLLEVLAGETMVRLARAANLSRVGRVMLDAHARRLLNEHVILTDDIPASNYEPGYAIAALKTPLGPIPNASPVDNAAGDELFRPWLLPPVYQRLHSGQGEFLTELRYTLSLFMQFADLDYDNDAQVGAKLNTFIQWVQHVLSRYEGWLLQMIHGDKGSYLYATFGAPIAHGDDTARVLGAALELSKPPKELSHMGPMKIGISGGLSWTGAVGGSTRTYGVMGDATNLAARLMQAADTDQILVSANLAPLGSRRYLLEALPPIMVRGKAAPVPIMVLRGARTPQGIQLPEPQYALPLIVRTTEAAQLQEKIEQALGGQGQIVNITGEAGIGKSRLAAEAIRLALLAGFTCFGGAALSTRLQAAYFAWQPIWRAFFGLDSSATLEAQLAALEHALTRLDPQLLPRLPLLGAVTGLAIPENDLTRNLDARLRKESLEGLLVNCLKARAVVAGELQEEAAKTQPILLVLEDTHWLDVLSIDLLVAISRTIATLPVLLVITNRPAEPDHRGQLLLSDLPRLTEIQLTELTDEAAAQLIERQVAIVFGPQNHPTPQLIEAITARSDGNPFYIEELISYLKDRDISPDDSTALQFLELPGSLASLILNRIDQLSAGQQTVLKVASVIGRTFRFDWLWAVYPALGTPERVRQDLDALARLDVTPLDTPEPDLSYLFKHATIQEVAYASMPHAMLAQLHEQLAQWLESRLDGEAALDLLVYHYGRSTNIAKQREYLQKAAEAAAHRYANAPAIQHYERLLTLLEPSEQGPVLIALGKLSVLISEWDAAETRYRAVLAFNEANLCAQAQLGLGTMKRTLGLYQESEAWLQEAQQGFTALNDGAGLIDTLAELAFVYLFQAKTDLAQTLMEQGMALTEAEGDQRLMARILHMRGNVAVFKADYETACQYWQRSMDMRRVLGDKEGVADLALNLATVMFDVGRYDEAQTLVSEFLALCNEIGSRQSYAEGRQLLSVILMVRGEVEAARTTQFENLALARDLQAMQQVVDGLILLAWQTQLADQTLEASRYAARLVAAALNLQATTGGALHVVIQKRADIVTEEVRRLLGATEIETMRAEGQAMGWQEAVAYALTYGSENSPRAASQ